MKTDMKAAEDAEKAVMAEQSRFLTSFGMTKAIKAKKRISATNLI